MEMTETAKRRIRRRYFHALFWLVVAGGIWTALLGFRGLLMFLSLVAALAALLLWLADWLEEDIASPLCVFLQFTSGLESKLGHQTILVLPLAPENTV